MGDGALILLLAEDPALAAEEELLAELGYEPLGFALSTPHAVLREAALACDAIVISSPHIRVVEALLHDLADVLQGRRLLVAAPDPFCVPPAIRLDFPCARTSFPEPCPGEAPTSICAISRLPTPSADGPPHN
jgi:hypothetical protein